MENQLSDEEGHDHPGEDFVVLGPKTEDGRQTVIRHREDHSIELAELRSVEDGKPMPEGAELVQLSGKGPAYKVESIYDSRKGPAKVTTGKYRDNYDVVFGNKTASKDLN